MRFALAAASVFLLAHAAPGQENQGNKDDVYRLSFAVHETGESRTTSTKNYSMLLRNFSKGVIRIGNKVPVQTAPGNNYTYVDIGLNLDCRLQETDRRIGLHAEVEMSNISQDGESKLTGQPIIRQIKSTGDAILAPGKPTVVATLDDPATKRHYEIEVTATKTP